MGSSIVLPDVIIKSASSSIITIKNGIFSRELSSELFLLYSWIFLTLTSENIWNRLSISLIAEFKILTEFSAVVITYSSNWGAVIK